MKPRCYPALAALLLSALAPLTQAAPNDRDPRGRLRETEKELEHAREELHEAMKELAAQKEKVEELEKQLKDLDSPKPEGDRGKKDGKKESKKAKPEAKKPEAKKPESKKSEASKKPEAAKKPQPAPRLFSFTFEEKKAANLEGREDALQWVRTQLERNPAVRIRITAQANDSEYAETNQTIAENRARFLADYLALSGIDRQVLAEVKGEVSQQKGEAGRRVLLEVVGDAKKG